MLHFNLQEDFLMAFLLSSNSNSVTTAGMQATFFCNSLKFCMDWPVNNLYSSGRNLHQLCHRNLLEVFTVHAMNHKNTSHHLLQCNLIKLQHLTVIDSTKA